MIHCTSRLEQVKGDDIHDQRRDGLEDERHARIHIAAQMGSQPILLRAMLVRTMSPKPDTNFKQRGQRDELAISRGGVKDIRAS